MPTPLEQNCLIALSLLTFGACADKPGEPAPAPAATAETAPAQPAAPAAPAAPSSLELPAIPEGARVWFIEPADGAKVQGAAVDGKVTVDVKMGAEGIAVKPAGQIEAGSGHHHILIDTAAEPQGAVVPQDEKHLHFGKGQTEAKVTLEPGEHTLQLQFADGIHRSYGPRLSAAIKVTVAGEAAPVAASPVAPAGKVKAEAPHTAVHAPAAHEASHQH